MSVHGKRVLITGGSGLIGSHLARACVREGAQVTCVLRSGSNPWRLLEARPLIQCVEVDLTDAVSVASMVNEVQPEIIFHLAADTNRKRKLELYEGLHATHVRSTLNLVSAALTLPKVTRFVYTGTIEEYGRGPVPFREDQREQAISPYSLTKLAASQLVLYAAREQGLPAVVLRPSLTYGPLKGKGMFIPDCIHAAMTTKIFAMSLGEQTRDFIHVDDVVRAHLAAAVAIGIEGEVLNVATGVETPLKYVSEKIRTLFDGHLEIQYGAYPCDPRVETMRCFMDVQKIAERLSWRSMIGLDDGLARTVEWYRNSSNNYPELWR